MSIDEHYGFLSSVGFQQKLIVNGAVKSPGSSYITFELNRQSSIRISSYLLTRCVHWFM